MSDSLNMGIQKHREFVDKLIDDEDLRRRFEADPKAVLHEHGIGFNPSNPPGASAPISHDQMQQGRENLIKSLDDNGGWDLMEEGSWDLKES